MVRLSERGAGAIDINGVFRYLERDLRAVERLLASNLKSATPVISAVGKHITLSGGKRIRPALLLLCADACGYRGARRIGLSAATEYMHTATLLHDDVVDLGMVRRGKPSANMVFGNSVSVLVGDFMFARASQLIVDNGGPDIFKVYARTLVSIAEGEVMQLAKTHDVEITEKQYLDVIYRKTASFFAAICEVGAMLAEADKKVRQTINGYGRCVGMAFQLIDDALDYAGAEKKLGKRLFQDLREGKITLPLLHALREAGDAERKRALKALAGKKLTEPEIAFLAELVKRNGGVEYTVSRAEDFIRRGKQYLRPLPDSKAKDAMAVLADYVVSRTS